MPLTTSTPLRGYGFAPSLDRSCYGGTSKDTCLQSAKACLRRVIREHIKWCDGFHPEVARLATKAIQHVPEQEQLSLF